MKKFSVLFWRISSHPFFGLVFSFALLGYSAYRIGSLGYLDMTSRDAEFIFFGIVFGFGLLYLFLSFCEIVYFLFHHFKSSMKEVPGDD